MLDLPNRIKATCLSAYWDVNKIMLNANIYNNYIEKIYKGKVGKGPFYIREVLLYFLYIYSNLRIELL